jgi:omega-amidase
MACIFFMKITIVQTNIIWEDIKGNLKKIRELVRPVFNATDVIVLPEMFSTGFSMNTGYLAEDKETFTFNWMKKLSAEGNFAVCGSYIVRENGSYYNRFHFVTRDGAVNVYDKRHLFSISGEDSVYERGTARLVFNFDNYRICPVICYDLRFPVWIRNRNDYDVLVCVANWPDSRQEVWNILLKSRAMENQCFVVGVNRVGNDGAGYSYAGESVILDPYGKQVALVEKDREGIATAEISINDLEIFRRRFPVWKDADDFTLSI